MSIFSISSTTQKLFSNSRQNEIVCLSSLLLDTNPMMDFTERRQVCACACVYTNSHTYSQNLEVSKVSRELSCLAVSCLPLEPQPPPSPAPVMTPVGCRWKGDLGPWAHPFWAWPGTEGRVLRGGKNPLEEEAGTAIWPVVGRIFAWMEEAQNSTQLVVSILMKIW